MVLRKRNGAWIQTYSGSKFYPLDPRTDDVHITDIAHHLGMVCRFNGACTRFYSVAEHSYILSTLVDHEHAMHALLHDAAEAYIGDAVAPFKGVVTVLQRIERRIMNCIFTRFQMCNEVPAQVKAYDKRLLMNERAAIMRDSNLNWGTCARPFDVIDIIHCWSPEKASKMFLRRWLELASERSLRHHKIGGVTC